MANITITIPDDQVSKLEILIPAVAGQYGYEPTLKDGSPNPVSAQEFVISKVCQFLVESAQAYQAEQAAKTARENAVADVNTNMTIPGDQISVTLP